MAEDFVATAPASEVIEDQPDLDDSPTPSPTRPVDTTLAITPISTDAPTTTEKADERVAQAQVRLDQAVEAKKTTEVVAQPNTELLEQAEAAEAEARQLRTTIEARVHPVSRSYEKIEGKIGKESIPTTGPTRTNEATVVEKLKETEAWDDTPKAHVEVVEALRESETQEAERLKEKADQEWRAVDTAYRKLFTARLKAAEMIRSDKPKEEVSTDARREYYAAMKDLAQIAEVKPADAVRLANLHLHGLDEFPPYPEAIARYPGLEDHPGINAPKSEMYAGARKAHIDLTSTEQRIQSDDSPIDSLSNIQKKEIPIRHSENPEEDVQALIAQAKRKNITLTAERASELLWQDAFQRAKARADTALETIRFLYTDAAKVDAEVRQASHASDESFAAYEAIAERVNQLVNPDGDEHRLTRDQIIELWVKAEEGFSIAEALRRQAQEQPVSRRDPTPLQDHAVTAARRELALAQQEAERKHRAHEVSLQPKQVEVSIPTQDASPTTDNALLLTAETRAANAESAQTRAEQRATRLVQAMVRMTGEELPADLTPEQLGVVVDVGYQFALEGYNASGDTPTIETLVDAWTKLPFTNEMIADLPEKARSEGALVRGAGLSTATYFDNPALANAEGAPTPDEAEIEANRAAYQLMLEALVQYSRNKQFKSSTP